MDKLTVFLVHGFRSHCEYMIKFHTLWKNNHIHFKTIIHNHNWFAGWPESNITTGFKLLFGRRNAADKIKLEWDEAVENFNPASEELAKKINSNAPPDTDILLVGHSMGTEIIRLAIEMVRPDINIYLFLMAGVANTDEIEELFNLPNVHLAINLYSNKDIILDEILPEMDTGNFYMPIGTNKIYHDSALEIETTLGHSDYLGSQLVFDYYTMLVTKLLDKAQGEHLVYSPS